MINVCIHCGKEFATKHRDTKFCSDACSAKYNRRTRAKTKHCRTCGKPLEALSRELYCSKECKNKWIRDNPHYEKICPQCGQAFRTNLNVQVYCGEKCSGIAHQQHNTAICKNCGKEFPVKRTGIDTFCSRECSFEWMHKNKKVIEPKMYTLKCAECGVEFESVRKKKYCSSACMQRHYRSAPKEYTLTCKQCGTSYIAGACTSKYCGEECRKKHDNYVRYISRDKRLRKNGTVDNTVSLDALCVRDKGVCALCGMLVDMNSDCNSGEYGSVDHIKPISIGGTHAWSNVQLAHRGCNTQKGNHYDG